MGREEQIEEREVLESIFPDEITGDSITGSTRSAGRQDADDDAVLSIQISPRPNIE